MADDPEKGQQKPKNWVNFSEENEEVPGEGGEGGTREQHPAVIEPSVEIHQTPVHANNHVVSPGKGSNNVGHHHPLAAGGTTRPDGTVIHKVGGDGGGMTTVELRQNHVGPGGMEGVSVIGGQNGGGAAAVGGQTRRNTSGFTNGDVIVSILPVNTKWPWVTPASFRPELVPEELMVPGLTLTVEEYVHAMEILTSDFRFNAYTICYKRLLAAWLSTAFFILLIILFSGVMGIQLFALGISWLIINAVAVFLCMYIKIKINQGLERCMAKVNKLLFKHKLIIGLDDRGRISCHKVHLCFIYFDPNDCVKRLEQMLEASGGDRQRMQNHLDACDVEIVISGAQNTTRIPRKQSEVLYLRYIQRWAKAFLRELATTGSSESPLHCPKQQCPCQFIKALLEEKRITGGLGALLICRNLAEATPNSYPI